MALISRCCCCNSVRSGSFVAAFYTLWAYLIILSGAAFNLQAIFDVPSILVMNLVMIGLYILCIISSVILIHGLCSGKKKLLLPWLTSIATTTISDVILTTLHLLKKTFNAFDGIFISIDVILWIANMYCLLCVLSQYQNYEEQENSLQTETKNMVQPVGYQDENCYITCVTVKNDIPKKVLSDASNFPVTSETSSGGQNEGTKVNGTDGIEHENSATNIV